MPFAPYAVFGPDELKPCTKCDQRLPAESFSADKRNPANGLQTWCKACVASYRPQIVILENKWCPKCAKSLPIDCFGTDKKSKTGRRSRCKTCHSGDGKERHKNMRGNDHYDATRHESKLKREYGITAVDYGRILAEQNNSCAICFGTCAPRKHFDVDHSHATGQVRGLLCRNCNNAVGLFGEDISVVERAILYLLSTPGLLPVHYKNTQSDPVLNKSQCIDLKRRFKIDAQKYLALWRFQGGMCAVCYCPCKTGDKLCVDHSHITGVVRGLLCRKCNMALGKFKDNPHAMARIRQYLTEK